MFIVVYVYSVHFQPKCEKYWPDKGTKKYGDIEITLMKTEEFADHVTHTLQLKKVEKMQENVIFSRILLSTVYNNLKNELLLLK
jgi:hypothetical protein